MNKTSYISWLRLLVLSLLLTLTACNSFRASPSQENSQATPTPTAGENPSVIVHNQETDGASVIIDDVISIGPAWMVIHNQVDGKLGDAIGEIKLDNGVSKNIVVKIDPAQATPVMYAMLHEDAGTVGKYEFPGPDVPVMVNGEMIAPAFNATIVSTAMMTPTPGAANMSMATPSGESANLSIKVSDQALAGDTVMVDEVVSSGSGWVVIYTTNASGQPDQPIGYAAVSDGDNQMVMVQVDPTKAQGTLYVQLHVDQGTIGTFEYPGVDAPVMNGVQMIASSFKIISAQPSVETPTPTGTPTPVGTPTPTGTAAPAGTAATPGAATPAILQPSITVSDQAIQDGTVTIPQVVSNGNWWLVIHRQNLNGEMGEYIGQTLIKNGINTNVVVEVNMNLVTPVLYAMLHEDHDPIGVLEFPGSDIPVMINGQMIAPSFNVTGIAQDITIDIRKISDTVSILTDGQGNSLYISLRDVPGKSNCTADCLQIWKPLLVSGRLLPGDGVDQANLGVILLPDGTRQVTYLGAPLYYYSEDVNPGDTNGHGVDGVWFLVTP